MTFVGQCVHKDPSWWWHMLQNLLKVRRNDAFISISLSSLFSEPLGSSHMTIFCRWCLLVQELDRWEPAVADLKTQFSFIPNWRVDDVMASLSLPGGVPGCGVASSRLGLGLGSLSWWNQSCFCNPL